MSINQIFKNENKYLLFILLLMLIASLSSGQKAVINIDHKFSFIFPELKYDGEIFDDYTYPQFASNLSISINAQMSKMFYLKSEIGSFDFKYESRIGYRNEGIVYRSQTNFQSIHQHYIGFYPGLFFNFNDIALSLGVGPDFYFVRTTVFQNSLKEARTGSTFRDSRHPILSPVRIGLQGFADFHIKFNNIAFSAGMSYRYNHLYKERSGFPAQLLYIYELNLGASYFIK